MVIALLAYMMLLVVASKLWYDVGFKAGKDACTTWYIHELIENDKRHSEEIRKLMEDESHD